MQKKILIIAPKTEGGITAVIDNYIKAGLNKNNDILVHPSTFECSGYKKLYFFIRQLVITFYLLVKYRPDTIHIHSASDMSYYRKSFHILLAKLFQKKIIIQIHANHFIDFISHSKRFQQAYILRTLSLTQIIITLTQNVQDYLTNFKILHNSEIRLLPNPIYLNDYSHNDFDKREACTLIYLGWIVKEKGVYDLLEAAPLVKQKLKNFKLIYCGNKETQFLRNQVQDSDIAHYITINDWINGEEKRLLLQRATALILPSYSEAMPNVILEAMASGTPILSTFVGQVPAILKDHENCLYIEAGDSLNISEKIVELFTDRELQNKIRIKNLEKVKQFDAKSIVRNLQKLYEELI